MAYEQSAIRDSWLLINENFSALLAIVII